MSFVWADDSAASKCTSRFAKIMMSYLQLHWLLFPLLAQIRGDMTERASELVKAILAR